jgi:hypothetical protein
MARPLSEIDADLASVRAAMSSSYSYKQMGSDGTSVQFQDLKALMDREAALLAERACAARTRFTRGRPIGV